MASTFSDLKIELIGTGEQVGTWGSTTNTNLGTAVEEAIVGSADVSFSSTDVTVTLTDSNGTQTARHLRLNLTGTSGGARQLILGSGCQIEKPYIINNGLADAVTVKNTAGTGVVVPAGKSMWVFNNSVNVVEVVTHVNATVTGNVTGNVTGTAGNVTGIVAVANGGTGTATPGLVQGTNVTITGAWPNQTINSTGGGGGSGTVTSVSGTGTVSGLTLSGTVTTSGSLTLGGAITDVGGLVLGRGLNSVAGNVAIGVTSLSSNTTGDGNIGVGNASLSSNTTGSFNIAVGLSQLQNNTTGNSNTSIGTLANILNTTGSENTSIGREALFSITTGSNNTGVGFQAAASSATVSNTITLGNSAITALRCQVQTITSLSDVRDKTNIVDIPAGLSFIKALRPVSFDWNMRDGGKVGVREFGFIAQELQKAQIDTGIVVPNLIYDDNLEKLETSTGALIPILIKAIQELNARLDAQDVEISILKGN